MRQVLHAVLRVIAVAVPVIGAAVLALLLVDRINPPPRRTDPGIAAVDSTRRSRLLILHVDSWRDESARDSTLFPAVARLRREGASGTLLGVYEGFTIPAVRAAFTGHAETQLVNLVHNFHFTALPIESFFRDVATVGKRALVVGREPFAQFGPVFDERVPPIDGRDMYTTDRLRPPIALRGYREEPWDVVVCHWESFDWVAHEEGIATDRYRASARQSDSVIAAFAAARAPGDYLLVYGDHGHTTTGEHKTGYDIPTFWLLLGPDVTAGATLPPLPITNLRYVASHAVGITLRSEPYDLATIGAALPVVRGDAAPVVRASFVREPVQRAITLTNISRQPLEYLTAAAVLLVAIGIAALCWRLLPPPSLSVRDLVTTVAALVLLFAAGRFVPAAAEPLRPAGFPLAVALYVVGVVAKLVLLRDGGRMAWLPAAATTTVLALVEFRAIEHPAVIALLSIAALVATVRVQAEAYRRLARIALLQLLLYFTLRLPIYLFPWIDLFLLAVWATRPDARYLTQVNTQLNTQPNTRLPVWHDVLLVGGAWTLACGTLAGNLEWGFLYTLFPAHVVELDVQWFLPFILAKIPLLLLLTLVVAQRAPDRALAQVVMIMTALRFAAVWVMRLAGAPTAELWPLAEQGAYLTTFVTAVVAWGWHRRASSPARRAAL